MGVLGFYVAVFGKLYGLFASQELWLEHCSRLLYIFGFNALLSSTDGCRDGQRPRKEKMGGMEAVMAFLPSHDLAPLVGGSLERVRHLRACEAGQ